VSANDPGRPHVPLRPLWLCRSCTAAWPCLTARNRLPVEYHADPVGLHRYLATMLQAAIDDLYRLNPDPGPDPAIMYARFLAWVGPRLLVTRARPGVDASGNWCRPRGGPPSAGPRTGENSPGGHA
jgi:hypothetical protein